MHNVYLFQPQYGIEFRKETNYYLPFAIGCIWTYANQFDDINTNFQLKEVVFRREFIPTLLERMDKPAYCGFSCYVWNEQYCLALAKAIKEKWPKCVIQFGGPHAHGSMTKFNYIDSIVNGEGEEAFVSTLRDMLKNKEVELFYNKQRIQDLSQMPSPYLTGFFDQMIRDNPDVVWAMSMETNRGCPYSCTFCDWGGVNFSKIKKFNLEKVAGELEWATRHPIVYMAFADANFGIFKERDLAIAKMIRHTLDHSQIEAINLQYAKNSTDAIFDIARTIGEKSRGITVSVQSMNESTLEAVKRTNLDVNDIQHMMSLSEKYNVTTYTEVIVGLPLETKESWRRGITEILELGQHYNMDCWFAQLLPNSEMSSPESRRKYGIQSQFTKNFMSLNQTKHESDVPELTEIIMATKTMTVEELADCYMYAWMIIQMHINGYSQLIARAARNIYNIKYLDFYNLFYKKLSTDSVIGQHCTTLHQTLLNWLMTGDTPENFVGGMAFHTASYKFCYDHRDHIAKTAYQVLEELTSPDLTLLDLQKAFIIDVAQDYPKQISYHSNVFTGEASDVLYEFQPKVQNLVLDNFYTLRRQGLIKTKMTIK